MRRKLTELAYVPYAIKFIHRPADRIYGANTESYRNVFKWHLKYI